MAGYRGPKMGHGDGERMYDFMVLCGLNPVPWQFDLLQRLEQQSIDEQFRDIARVERVDQ